MTEAASTFILTDHNLGEDVNVIKMMANVGCTTDGCAEIAVFEFGVNWGNGKGTTCLWLCQDCGKQFLTELPTTNPGATITSTAVFEIAQERLDAWYEVDR
jgi:hypothetical protein